MGWFHNFNFLFTVYTATFTIVKWIEYILNILFWIITGWAIAGSFSIQGQEIEILNDVETVKTMRDPGMINQILICVIISMLMFYSNLFNIHKLKKSISKVKILLVSIVLFLSALIIYYFIEKLFLPDHYFLPNTLSIGIFLFYFTISSAYGVIKVWIQTEQKQKDLVLAKKQAELNLLRNQLQPHFLFNALNNLLSLVDQKKSPKLSGSIEQLSQLLRHVIEESQNENTTISKEIQFVKNYCELQMLRFEESELDLQFVVKGENIDQRIEPGLFIPFVENAIKYGAEPEISSTIEIEFDTREKECVEFRIKNKVMIEMRKMASTGTGINAVKERLNLVYPNKYSLDIDKGEYFNVKLKIHTN